MRSLSFLSFVALVLFATGCEGPDAATGAGTDARLTTINPPPGSDPVMHYYGHDTLHVASLTVQFPDGNHLRFTSTGVGVLIAGNVGGNASNIGFGAGSKLSVGAEEFLVSSSGFSAFGQVPSVSRPTILGDRSNGEALAVLLQELRDMGLIYDNTQP